MTEKPITAGVIGVGAMGKHHARVYKEIPEVRLAGIADANDERAGEIATKYGTVVRDRAGVIDRCDIVSIAVPTRYHYPVATEAIEAGVHVLVEKPFVESLDQGRDLIRKARQQDVCLQVGHIERFNPAVQALLDIIPDLDVIAVDVRRLGPPVDRDSKDSVIRDLMIHDIDILRMLMASDVSSVTAMSACDGNHVTAQAAFESGVVGNLTASRVTQEKIRDLAVTAQDCRVNVDYENQSVEIHRHSVPEYYEADGDIRYRHESIIEQPTIENGEPLRGELEAFVSAVDNDSEPPVTGKDGLEAIQLARQIEEQAMTDDAAVRS